MTIDYDDLCKRLRHGFADENYSGQVDAIMDEAAAAIAALREQVADKEAYIVRLREVGANLMQKADDEFERAEKAEADNAALRQAITLARPFLPQADALPKTKTQIREAVEAIDAALLAGKKP